MKKYQGVWMPVVMLALLSLVIVAGCGSDKKVTPELVSKIAMTLFNMEPAAANWIYEVWVSNDTETISVGKFQVTGFRGDGSAIIADENGNEYDDGVLPTDNLDLTTFESIMVTVESPAEQGNPTPSSSILLYTDIDTTKSILDLKMPSTYGITVPFEDSVFKANGTFIIATPSNDGGITDPDRTDSLSGLWFITKRIPADTALFLADAPEGWKYAAWVTKDGLMYDMGRFTNGGQPDNKSSYYSNTLDTPAFPGEDFLENLPQGVTLPFLGGGELVQIVLMPESYPTELYSIRILEATLVQGPRSNTEYPLSKPSDGIGPIVDVPQGKATLEK